jgi:iron complex outermembrane recepter protein
VRHPVLSGLCLAPLVLAQPVLAETVNKLEEVSISATRGGSVAGQTPQKITVITREELEQQLAVTSDTSQVLSNLIPSFSPSRQKLTNSGETFRGRNPLFMIDGVPQSNPLRDGSRDGYTIDLSMVERIEIIHGASAEHGLGATGGIINFVTRRPEGTQIRQRLGMRASAPTDYDEDGVGYKLDYRVEGVRGNWDFLAAATFEERGMYYDADGRAIGIDPAQGDTMDSRSHDLFLKVGYWLTENQQLQFTVNRFELDGHHDYVLVSGDRANGVPATSVPGSPEGDAPKNDVVTTNLTYRHDNWLGNQVLAQVYTQRFRALYGGSRAGTFQDPAYAPINDLFDQSQNESDKVGAKFTVTRDGMLNNRLKITTGLDVLQDETSQVLTQTGREWVPETRFENIAPFVQGEYRATQRLSLHSGVRYEYAKLKVDDFTTLASYNGGQFVEGGEPSFDETLFNFGVVYQVTDWAQLFANYSEGFGMPDVGRVLRAVNQPNQSVDDFIDLEPIVTDNQEIGWRFRHGAWDAEISYFRSDSDLGARLEQVNGVFEVMREKSEIEGMEVDTNYQLTERHRIGASYAHVNGKYDSDRDGHTDTRLGARDISPDRLTLRWQTRWNDRIASQMTGNYLFSRNYPGNGADNDFNSYTLVDASLIYTLSEGKLSFGIDNLFNEDYFTFFAQSAGLLDDQYTKGRGRTLSVGYSLDF